MAALIAAQREQHQIPHAVACRAPGVSRSWYYKHKAGLLTPRAARRQVLAAEIGWLFRTHRGTYGSPRITADLREAEWKVSENRVAAIMREHGPGGQAQEEAPGHDRPGKGALAGGRKGQCWDNAVIESWHSTLEFELRRVEHYATRAAARAGVAAWIEDYNHHRRHSSLGRVSPVDYERSLAGKEPA